MKFNSLPSKFRKIAINMPYKNAIEYGNESLTYLSLDQKSNQLANFFNEVINEKDKRILIMMDRCPNLIESLLGILKIDGIFIPISPYLPLKRYGFIIDDTKSNWVVTHTKWLDKLNNIMKIRNGIMNVILMDNENVDVNKYKYLNIHFINGDVSKEFKVSPNIINKDCYIFFTSGSTGKPKGIIGRHRSLVHFIEWEIKEFNIDDKFRVSQLTAPTFDAVLRDIFVPLCCGGTICIPHDDSIILNELELIKWIEKKQITLIHTVPSLFRRIANVIDDNNVLNSLKYILLSGEMVRGNDVKKFMNSYKNKISLVNLYGTTETTMIKLFHTINDNDVTKKNIPVGKPIDSTQVMILDDYLNICQQNVAGEVYIRTPFITSGYCNKELNREVFIKNPFSKNPNDIIYKTGDIGKILTDGNIEIMGRKDNQVKIRGIRIDISEIENSLLKYKKVNEAIILAKDDLKGNKDLYGYIVGDKGLTVKDLRHYLSKELPDYMIPQFYVQLDQMPMTTNGKIDRRKLLSLDANMKTGVQYEKPRDDIDAKLIEICEDILKVDDISINDEFFLLGGHSLKATNLVARINKEFNKELPLKKILSNPTIKEISDYIKIAEISKKSSILPAEEKEYYPVSSTQKRIFILEQYEGVGVSYNIPNILEIEGEFNKDKFENIIKKLVKRHEAFRTSFEIIEGEIVQRVHKNIEFNVDYYEADEKRIDKIIKDYIRPFNLSYAPLIRVGLIEISDSKTILIIDIHHIVSDGVSVSKFVSELIDLYEGRELTPLNIQYKDYAVWEKEHLQSKAVQNMKEYWLDEFKGEIPVLNMPTDYNRPNKQSYEGTVYEYVLNKELSKRIEQFAYENKTTLFTVLLAIYSITLSKYSGQNDLVIGTVTAGRTSEDLQNIMGAFIKNIAYRCNLQKEMTFKDYLKGMNTKVVKGFENQDYPIEELIDNLNIKKEESRNVLFDVMLILQNFEHEVVQLSDFRFEQYNIGKTTSKYDITLYVYEDRKNNQLKLHFEYSTRLYKEETIKRISKHLINIINDILKNPQKKISQIDMITQEEKKEILLDFNNTKQEYPHDMTFHELFEKQVKETPNSIAVVYKDEKLTYKELNERANQLARMLRNKGVKQEVVVGIMVERSIEMIIGILGIMKAGGVYLPIDPEYPQDRKKYILDDSDVNILLTEKELVVSGEIIDIKDKKILQEDNSNLLNINNSKDLIYVIYTSGSTGKPKGVMVEHKNVVNISYGWKKDYELDKHKVNLLQMASFSFDVFAGDLARTLLNGGKMVVTSKYERINPIDIYKLIKKYEINIFEATPALIIPLMDFVYENGLDISELKLLIFGSDVCSVEEFRKISVRFGQDMKIINSYGVTEATIDSSFYEVKTEEINKITRVPIGKPLQNISFYVLDEDKNIQPIGVLGELYISGAGVARGYINRKELTEQKFIDNPFKLGEKMYKTGDLARWLEDGNIEFYGRIDNQVKINGYRIELGEIENELLKHESIKEAVAVAREEVGEKSLCAYIVGDKDINSTQIREYLLKELPEYMVPPYILNMESLPLTPNGKIDRHSLPKPQANKVIRTEYVKPSNETEEKLVEIYKEVLGLETVGIKDNFFELGGQSLKAIKLIAKIHKEFNVNFPLGELFKAPIVQQTAKNIQKLEKSVFNRIEKAKKADYYPLSAAQNRMYTLQELDKNNVSYNITNIMTIEGKLEKERLNNAFVKLINRHESLRTSFVDIEDCVVQTIKDEIEFEIDYFIANEKNSKDIICQYIRPFDLSKAPLIRVGLIKISQEKHVLMIDMHHIISDGLSVGIITNEFFRLYENEKLPELRLQYKDYTIWQNNLFKSKLIKKQEEYWINKFSDEIPVLNLPTDYTRPKLQSFEGDKITIDIDKDLTQKIRKLAVDTDSTSFIILLSAFNVLLSKYSGQEDIVVGTPVAGRGHIDLENIIGMFVNTLALRNFPCCNKSFYDFLRDVKEKTIKAFEYQDFPFEELISKLNISRDLSRNPLFNVMFVFQNAISLEKKIDNVKFKPMNFNNKSTKFDLLLEAIDMDNNIKLHFEYCTKLYKKETIKRLSEHFINILNVITENPQIEISKIDLLSLSERNLLMSFNNTSAAYSKYKTINEIFEEKVMKKPNQIAVIYGEEKLTYSELNHKANQLARLLVKSGLKKGNIVGIMVTRSLEMVIGILGIIKAGGAFLPINPEHPIDRIKYFIEDSDIKILLTQGALVNNQEKTIININTKALIGLINDLKKKYKIINIDDKDLYNGDANNLKDMNNANSLAYIIYTSGSTGKPKGVLIRHFSVVNILEALNEDYPLSKTDSFLLKTTFTFDVFITEIFGWFFGEGKLVILENGLEKDPEGILRAIDEYNITHINFVPSMFKVFTNNVIEYNTDIIDKLKYVFVAGEALTKDIVDNFYKKFENVKLENIYGPTESTIYATRYSLNKTNVEGNIIPIGKPFNNMRIYILDKNKNMQPIGIPGEICIAGEGLASGYLNQPDLTQEKFISNPFEDGGIIYKSGDVGRWNENGNIEFLGRIDYQVKIRGHRIEPREIEVKLMQSKLVNQALVIDKADENNNKFLCAYVVSDNEEVSSDIREYLSMELPQYMIPAKIVQIESIPLTSHGKIDLKALPEPKLELDTELIQRPTNDIQTKLFEIWSSVLGIKDFGINDDFFYLGGDSIKAIQMMACVKKCKYKIELVDIFKYPTIKELSKYVVPMTEEVDNSVIVGKVTYGKKR
ncbi:non-ribosomal peptide synthetase [Abyssisolibacter fermentans]|uniref:non-ribosomal peptide synthetase n=1 Tax=Abyssisolibacter fermentans TaxID=1766203 RepID=UPI00082F8B33|nr:non-ribosomal peptide synthetase [Abyssisolibacter fermentans]